MTVRVTCPACKGSCNAPDVARGKVLKCPHCEGRLPIPEMPPIPVVPPKAPRPDTVWVRVEVEDEPPVKAELAPTGFPKLLNDLTNAAETTIEDIKSARWSVKALLASPVIIAIAFVIAAIAIAPPNRLGRHSETEVIIDAIAIARRSLRSPSTAEFPSSGWNREAYSVAKTGENQYTVSSYVDAQNGFGATLREPWTVTFEYVGDSKIRPISVNVGR